MLCTKYVPPMMNSVMSYTYIKSDYQNHNMEIEMSKKTNAIVFPLFLQLIKFASTNKEL
jgi:hypothetical protein